MEKSQENWPAEADFVEEPEIQKWRDLPKGIYILYQGLRKGKNQVRGGLYIEVRNERGRGGSSMGAPKDVQKVSGEAF